MEMLFPAMTRQGHMTKPHPAFTNLFELKYIGVSTGIALTDVIIACLFCLSADVLFEQQL